MFQTDLTKNYMLYHRKLCIRALQKRLLGIARHKSHDKSKVEGKQVFRDLWNTCGMLSSMLKFIVIMGMRIQVSVIFCIIL